MPRNITVSFEDGTQHVYENAPDDITPEAVIARASKEFGGVPISNVDGGRETQTEELPSRTGGDIVKDIGVTAGRSAISGLQQVEGLADLLPGVNATKYLSEHGVDLGKAKEYLQENASPQQQQAYKNLTEAQGAGNILSAAIENPSAVAELVGENIIPMLTGGAEAKLLTKGVPALAKYAPSIGEGLAQMGQEAQKLTAEAPDKELSGKGELAAIGSGALDAVIGRFAGKLVSKAGGTNVEDTLYGTLARDMGEEAARNPSVVKRVLVSTLGEGAEEALQSGQERIWDNYAKGATNLPTLLEGAVDDATLGSILGTVMGGGASVISGKGEQAPASEQPAVEPVQPTQPQGFSERDRKVDMEDGLELAGVNPDDHPELYAELSDPRHYESEETINALDERLKRYKSDEAPVEGEEAIDFASALPKEFDDTAWEAHLEKQREYARQTAPAAEQPQADNVAPEVTEPEVTEPEVTEPEESYGASHIPYESSETPGQIGASTLVNYAGRVITVRDVNGTKVPFYLSSGLAGKKNVASGKWYPFFGVGKDGWINKTSEADMNSYYGSPALKAAAEHLDNTIGDIRNDANVPKVGAEGRHMDFINEGLTPTEFKSPDTVGRVKQNIDKIISSINTVKEPSETVEPKPSVSISDAITEHNVESLQPHLTPEMRRLVVSGKLTLHDSMDTLPGEGHPENVQGLTTPQGEVHLVANKLTPETLPRVAMHEMGVHVGMRGMVGDKVWGDLTSQALTTKGDAFDRARQSVPENTPEHLKGEETLAYLVENAPNLPIVKRAISAVKNWARITFGAKLDLTEADAHHLAAKALRRESQTATRAPREETAFSVTPNSKLQEQVEKDRQGMRPAAVKKKKGLRDTLGISAKNMQDKADLYETKMVSHDARFVNSMRRTLQSMGLDPNVIGRIMDRISQAQTVNESSVAAEAALRGGMEYDKDTEFFVAVDKTDNVVSMRQLMEDAGKAEGWSEYETNRFFTTYMVSKRLQEMYKKMHSLKVEANKQTDPAAKSALYKQSRELKAKLDLESLSEEDCNKAIDAYKTVDGFVKAEKMWHKIRENVIGTLVDSGLYSKEKATAYFDAAAYAPMWRIMTKEVTNEELDNIYEDMATGAYKTNISSLTKGMRERSYKGSKRDVFNMMDNVEHWVQLSNSRAIRAKKATDLIDVARRYLPEGSVSRLYGTKTDKEGAITCYFHGKKQYWKFEDPLMALAFTGIPAAPLTFKLISDVSNLMRDTIVLAPTFTIAQLPQDIYSAAFSTGIKNPAMLLKDMVVEFGLTAFSKDKTQTHDILKRIGAVGSKDAYADSRSLHVYDTAHHTHLSSKPKGTLRKTKDWLEQFAMAGDNAIRQAVYKRTMKELEGDPRAKSIAYQRAFDVINFRRRGASAKLEQLRSMTPFMGAALQAQRAAFQVLAGRGLAYQSSADNKSIRKRLLSTSMVMMVSSLLYNMLYGTVLGDDEDKDAFNKGDIHERDTHIMVFGGNSPVSVPIRPDIFALPFITGNHLFHGLGGDENPKQTLEAYRDAILSASGINIPLVPPAVKEPVQLAANYDFYTGRPIVAERLQGKLPEYQYDEKTSELGKLVGKFGVSPVKFDHMVKGIFGGMGTAVLGVSNISNLISDNPTKDYSAREIARMIPSMSGLVPKENFEQATDTYYSLDEEVRRANNTYNALVKDGKRAEAKEFKQDYKALLDPSVHQRMNHIKTELDKNHQKSRQISNNKNLSSEDKTAKLNALKTKERRLLSHVQTLYDKVH
jgi:hypothetical protein